MAVWQLYYYLYMWDLNCYKTPIGDENDEFFIMCEKKKSDFFINYSKKERNFLNNNHIF